MFKKNKWQKLEIFFEFLVFGIAVGIVEDVITIKLATGEPITWRVIGIIVIVAIPFAVLGEVIFDRINFAEILEKLFGARK